MLVLAVKKNQIGERFWWEGRVVEQEVQLLEARLWIVLDVHQRLIV